MAQAMPIRGARILLTGASGGLGQVLARRLAAQGGELVLTGRREEVLSALADELHAQAIVADLAQAGEVDRLVSQAGQIDILIANAALPGSGRVAVLSALDIDRAIAVNLRAPIALAQLLAPPMADRGSGHIVFIGSLSSKASTGGSSIYNATKFGLRGFSLALRAELAQAGVGVSIVLPGFIRDAGMYADARVALPWWIPASTPESVSDAVLRAIVTNRSETTVAPLPLRAGTLIASVAPEFAARCGRALGAERIARRFERAQADKR